MHHNKMIFQTKYKHGISLVITSHVNVFKSKLLAGTSGKFKTLDETQQV